MFFHICAFFVKKTHAILWVFKRKICTHGNFLEFFGFSTFEIVVYFEELFHIFYHIKKFCPNLSHFFQFLIMIN